MRRCCPRHGAVFGTPVLDEINRLMSRLECRGSMPAGIVLGSRQARAIEAEVRFLRDADGRGIRDPLNGSPDLCLGRKAEPTLWDVPVLLVDHPGRLDVVGERLRQSCRLDRAGAGLRGDATDG